MCRLRDRYGIGGSLGQPGRGSRSDAPRRVEAPAAATNAGPAAGPGPSAALSAQNYHWRGLSRIRRGPPRRRRRSSTRRAARRCRNRERRWRRPRSWWRRARSRRGGRPRQGDSDARHLRVGVSRAAGSDGRGVALRRRCSCVWACCSGGPIPAPRALLNLPRRREGRWSCGARGCRRWRQLRGRRRRGADAGCGGDDGADIEAVEGRVREPAEHNAI